jgi:hypothetical protein
MNWNFWNSSQNKSFFLLNCPLRYLSQRQKSHIQFCFVCLYPFILFRSEMIPPDLMHWKLGHRAAVFRCSKWIMRTDWIMIHWWIYSLKGYWEVMETPGNRNWLGKVDNWEHAFQGYIPFSLFCLLPDFHEVSIFALPCMYSSSWFSVQKQWSQVSMAWNL